MTRFYVKPIFVFLFMCMASFTLPTPHFAAPQKSPQPLLTVPEKTGHKATSTISDVKTFFDTLKKQHPENIHLSVIGKTMGNHDILLVTLGDPLPLSPQENKKPVVLINANIHGGEVEGKEAVQMLARDILKNRENRRRFLQHFTILLIPVLNVDGNEKINASHRPYQRVLDGVGLRVNSMNMDLNRDFVKLDSPEVRALVKTFDQWSPFLFVDCHTTNGSYHVEELTYIWGIMPAGGDKIRNYCYRKLHPFIKKFTLEKHKIRSLLYGYYDDPLNPKTWGWDIVPSIIYGSNYFGAKGVFSILNENYAYADFPSRIRACYSLLDGLLTYSLEHKKEMVEMVNHHYPQLEPALYHDVKIKPYPEKITVMGFEVEKTNSPIYHKRYKRGKRVDYSVELRMDLEYRSEPITGVYAFPPGLTPIREKLRQHGVTFYTLEKNTDVDALVYTIDAITYEEFPFQGRVRVKEMKGAYNTKKVTLEKGWTIVPLDKTQKYRRLVPLLLEPESSDGLIRYGFFNTLIFPRQWERKTGDYPVYRIPSF